MGLEPLYPETGSWCPSCRVRRLQKARFVDQAGPYCTQGATCTCGYHGWLRWEELRHPEEILVDWLEEVETS